MARSISVKIPTAQLISTIEAKIAEIDAEIADFPAKRMQYDLDLEAYKAEVAKFVSDYITKNGDKVGFDSDSPVRISNGMWNNRLEVVFDADLVGFPKRPTEPERPNQTQWFGREHATKKQLLERNLKILRMTSQEEVSASTYGAVMDLL